MTIASLIAEKLQKTGQSKTAAAKELKTTRVTLDTWLHGMHTPDEARYRRIAEWADEEDEARVLAIILAERGIEPSVFIDLARFADDPDLTALAKIRLNGGGVLGQTTHRAFALAA